jgi:hypothetical protein
VGFNYKIYMCKLAQEAIEEIEQLQEPENSSVPELGNSSVPGSVDSTDVISDQYSGSELKNSSEYVPNIQQANQAITQGALDTSALFGKLFQSYNLDQVGEVAGPEEAKNLFNNIVTRTLIKVQDGLMS